MYKDAKRARAYNFKVYFGPFHFSCAKISGIESIQDTMTFAEGGVNDRVYTTDGNPTTEKVLVFEKALSAGETDGSFFLYSGFRFFSDIFVFVLDEHKNPKWVYLFSGCYVKKFEYSAFDASRSEMIIQRMEVSYEMMKKTSIPLV